jgi:hypothetical protein
MFTPQLMRNGPHFDLHSFQQRLCQPTMNECTRLGGKSVEEFTLARSGEGAADANRPD